MHDVDDALAIQALEDGIAQARATGRLVTVVTPNLDHLWLLERSPEFRAAYDDAFLTLCDGKPLTWLLKRRGTPLTHGVMAGSHLFVVACAAAAQRGWKPFLFAGAPGRSQEAEAILAQRYPGFEASGHHCPEPGFEQDDARWKAAVQALNDAHSKRPLDLVFLALGAPKGELVAQRLRREGAPPAVYLQVGAAFDFVCGKPKRAPAWMRRIGMEWFYRLVSDPRRLFRRYILHDLPLFIKLWRKAGKSTDGHGV